MKNNFRHAIIFAVICFAAACGNMRPKKETPPVTTLSPISALMLPALSPLPTQDTVKRISIVFGGDVMQHMPQVTAAWRDSVYDYTETFQYLKPLFDTVDLVVVNLETTISADRHYSGYPTFSSPPALANGLKDCGVDVAMLANNHVVDKGLKGMVATADALDGVGIYHTGVFADSARYRTENPLRLNVKGVKLALLNYTYGLNGLPVPKGAVVNLIDTARIDADLALIDRRTTDLIIIFFHWGWEYARTPNRNQKMLAAWCREKGADIVVGSHPHVLQPIEIHRDSTGRPNGVTAYSLGNLVSNQRERYTDGGMLLKLDIMFRGSEPPKFETSYMLTWVHIPISHSKRKYIILPSHVADTLLKGSPSEATYRLFERDSRELLDGNSLLKEVKADRTM